jgi:hypothetical protein
MRTHPEGVLGEDAFKLFIQTTRRPEGGAYESTMGVL